MRRVVIGTNVLVSSALSPIGTPARIMQAVSDKHIQPFFNSVILEEYKRVLAYKKLNIAYHTQVDILTALE